jgi:hypothetical protein
MVEAPSTSRSLSFSNELIVVTLSSSRETYQRFWALPNVNLIFIAIGSVRR